MRRCCVCGMLTRRESGWMRSFAHSNSSAVQIDHRSRIRVSVVIDGERKKVITYGRDDVLPFGRPNARQVADGSDSLAERFIKR